MEDFSRFLFNTLDHIGYRSDIIRSRRNGWQEHTKAMNAIIGHRRVGHFVIAGSKAEGITSLCQSDIDHISLLNDAVCTSDIEAVSQIPNMTVIHVDTRDAPPGYTRLKLISSNGAVSRAQLQDCKFQSESKDIYLSSSLFAFYFMRFFKEDDVLNLFGGLSGPAVQTHFGPTQTDLVMAFNCYCPELLHSWASRPRYHDWPPTHVIEEASSMLAQVVPVGCKGSSEQWREWRFCFIKSELALTYSLNQTQLKLYVLLKMVAKEILSHVSDEISSYIMKNVTFWLSETLPGDVFRPENLFSLLVLSLGYLKSSIRRNKLPYYMIPGRNLLVERLTPDNRVRLSGLIEEIIQEGPRFLQRCSTLGAALTIGIAEPAVMIKYAKHRDLVEVLVNRFLLVLHHGDLFASNSVLQRLFETVLPEWRMLLARGIPLQLITDVILERIGVLLSQQPYNVSNLWKHILQEVKKFTTKFDAWL